MNKTSSKLFLALLTICFSYKTATSAIPASTLTQLHDIMEINKPSQPSPLFEKITRSTAHGILRIAKAVTGFYNGLLGTPIPQQPSANPTCSHTYTMSPLDMFKKPSHDPLITLEKLEKIRAAYPAIMQAPSKAPQATNPLPKAAATIPTQKPPAEIPKITTQNPTTSPESPAACSLTDAIKNKASEIKDSACDKASKVFSDATNATSSWISKTYNSASPYLISGAIIYAVAGYVYIYGVKRAQATNHWKSLSAAEQNKIPTHAVDHGSRIDNGILDKIFLPFVGWQYCCEKWIGNGKILFLI